MSKVTVTFEVDADSAKGAAVIAALVAALTESDMAEPGTAAVTAVPAAGKVRKRREPPRRTTGPVLDGHGVPIEVGATVRSPEGWLWRVSALYPYERGPKVGVVPLGQPATGQPEVTQRRAETLEVIEEEAKPTDGRGAA